FVSCPCRRLSCWNWTVVEVPSFSSSFSLMFPMTDRVFNFSPGPAVMPVSVLEQIQREMLVLPGVGMSVLEISHRSKAFDSILAEAQALTRELLAVPDNYRIIFLQGGAHLQFTMVAMNFLRDS